MIVSSSSLLSPAAQMPFSASPQASVDCGVADQGSLKSLGVDDVGSYTALVRKVGGEFAEVGVVLLEIDLPLVAGG